MKFIIAGSRECCRTGEKSWDYYQLVEIIDDLVNEKGVKITEVISGGANGPDKAGELWANAKGIKLTIMKADWRIGRGAGLIRNRQMADNADGLIALYDGKSRGTKHMINTMRKEIKLVYVKMITQSVD